MKPCPKQRPCGQKPHSHCPLHQTQPTGSCQEVQRDLCRTACHKLGVEQQLNKKSRGPERVEPSRDQQLYNESHSQTLKDTAWHLGAASPAFDTTGHKAVTPHATSSAHSFSWTRISPLKHTETAPELSVSRWDSHWPSSPPLAPSRQPGPFRPPPRQSTSEHTSESELSSGL